MVSKARAGIGDWHLQLRHECWCDRHAADCALAYVSLRMAHGLYRNRGFGISLDYRVARLVPAAGAKQSSVVLGTRLHPERSEGRSRRGEENSAANSGDVAPDVGRGVR